jgi:hypothetical protein
MSYYSVECEAPGGGYGPAALLTYDDNVQYIKRVDYLDLIFDVWLGGELVQDVQCYCVTVPLWHYLTSNGITGVSVRHMTVTRGDYMNEFHANRVIPDFKELVLPRCLLGQKREHWHIKKTSIPDADMFTGIGLPLFVSELARGVLVRYGVSGLVFQQAIVS